MCDYCNKTYSDLAVTERLEQRTDVDVLTLAARIKIPDMEEDENRVGEEPVISVTMTAGHCAYLMPELEIPIFSARFAEGS